MDSIKKQSLDFEGQFLKERLRLSFWLGYAAALESRVDMEESERLAKKESKNLSYLTDPQNTYVYGAAETL